MLSLWTRRAPLLILLAVTACSGSPDPSPFDTAPPSAAAGLGERSTPAGDASGDSSGNPAGDSSGGVPSAGATREITATYGFMLPSRNIGCLMTADSARCDIATKSWTAPDKPANCDQVWATGAIVGNDSPGNLTCAGDTVMGADATLPYGDAAKLGDFLCTSTTSGVRCENVISRHGFTLSRETFEVF